MNLISPEELLQKIEELSFDLKWDLSRFLEEWLDFWSSKGDRKLIYETCMSVVNHIGIKEVTGGLLDRLFPLAYEFDSDNAFELLCRAQANDNGWISYWSDKNRVEYRWNQVKEKIS